MAKSNLGELRIFALGNQPADDFAAEDVEDHIQVVPDTWRGTAQLGDIPTPDLTRPGREQLWPDVEGMAPLRSPLLSGGISR